MKKLWKSIGCVALSVALLVGCTPPAETTTPTETAMATATSEATEMKASTISHDGELSVGIVLPTKDEPRWVQDEQRFKEIFAEKGYKAEIAFSQGNSATEKQNVESFITKGIKVLIICPHDGAAAAAAVEEAKAEGITVINYDRLITGTDAVDYYVTFDSIAVGAAQGQYLVDKAQGTGVPLYLYTGAASDNNSFLLFEGAWNVLQPKIANGTFVIANSTEAEALKDKPKLTRAEQSKIIGQVTTNWDFNEAKKKAEAHLTNATDAQKGNVAIIAPNDGTSRSIADVFDIDPAVIAYGITGQDAEMASVQYIIDGKQSMTVFKDVRLLSNDAMDMSVSVLEGKTPDAPAMYNNEVKDVPSKQTPIQVVNKENVKTVLIDSGYYMATEFTGL